MPNAEPPNFLKPTVSGALVERGREARRDARGAEPKRCPTCGGIVQADGTAVGAPQDAA